MKRAGAATLTLPVCLGILAGCTDTNVIPAAPSGVDFTLDVSSGALSTNGGYTISNGIIVARTSSGSFIALSAYCTHEGATVQYVNQSYFRCPRHGATFSSTGQVTGGPASRSLVKYNTELSGSSLRVYS